MPRIFRVWLLLLWALLLEMQTSVWQRPPPVPCHALSVLADTRPPSPQHAASSVPHLWAREGLRSGHSGNSLRKATRLSWMHWLCLPSASPNGPCDWLWLAQSHK